MIDDIYEAWSATNPRQPPAARWPLAGLLQSSGPVKGHLAEEMTHVNNQQFLGSAATNPGQYALKSRSTNGNMAMINI